MKIQTVNQKEVIYRFYAAFENMDIEAINQLLELDCVWTYHGTDDIPFSGTYRGRQEVIEFNRQLKETVDIISFEPQQYIIDENKAAVMGKVLQKIRRNEELVRQSWVHVFSLCNNRIKKVDVFTNTAHVASQIIK